VAGFAWTPDGERILFLANDALHAIAAAGGDAVELTGPGNGRSELSASPDGRRIAVHHVDRRHLRKVPFPW